MKDNRLNANYSWMRLESAQKKQVQLLGSLEWLVIGFCAYQGIAQTIYAPKIDLSDFFYVPITLTLAGIQNEAQKPLIRPGIATLLLAYLATSIAPSILQEYSLFDVLKDLRPIFWLTTFSILLLSLKNETRTRVIECIVRASLAYLIPWITGVLLIDKGRNKVYIDISYQFLAFYLICGLSCHRGSWSQTLKDSIKGRRLKTQMILLACASVFSQWRSSMGIAIILTIFGLIANNFKNHAFRCLAILILLLGVPTALTLPSTPGYRTLILSLEPLARQISPGFYHQVIYKSLPESKEFGAESRTGNIKQSLSLDSYSIPKALGDISYKWRNYSGYGSNERDSSLYFLRARMGLAFLPIAGVALFAWLMGLARLLSRQRDRGETLYLFLSGPLLFAFFAIHGHPMYNGPLMLSTAALVSTILPSIRHCIVGSFNLRTMQVPYQSLK